VYSALKRMETGFVFNTRCSGGVEWLDDRSIFRSRYHGNRESFLCHCRKR